MTSVPKDMKSADPYAVLSPWGAVAGFFLVQCFGYVTRQGFRMFVHLGWHGSDSLSTFDAINWADRFLLPLWGLMWIFAFVAFEVDIFWRLSVFWREQSAGHLLHALRRPAEGLKALLALLFAGGFIALGFGHYPFPGLPIPRATLILFWLFGWGVSGLFAWGMRQMPVQAPERQEVHVVGTLMGFVTGAVFFAIARFLQPDLFYFHGMIGLGVMTMVTCQVLFKGSNREKADPAVSTPEP